MRSNQMEPRAVHLDAVVADPNQLETALLNLAVNARDAMPAGGILTMAARNEATVGDANLRPGRRPC